MAKATTRDGDGDGGGGDDFGAATIPIMLSRRNDGTAPTPHACAHPAPRTLDTVLSPNVCARSACAERAERKQRLRRSPLAAIADAA